MPEQPEKPGPVKLDAHSLIAIAFYLTGTAYYALQLIEHLTKH